MRRAPLDDDLAMVRHARQIEPVRGFDQLAPRRRVERPGAAQVEIEPAERRRRLNVERLVRAAQIRRERPRRGNRARHRRAEQRAGVDGDDVVSARAHEADALAAVFGDARVKGRAPPALAVRVDQGADLGLDARALERADEGFAFPFAIERRAHVLGRAAAANAEIGADGLSPLGAGNENFAKTRALGAFHRDDRAFAGQGAGNDRSVVGDALAALVQGENRQCARRVIHAARHTGIRARRRRRAPARG